MRTKAIPWGVFIGAAAFLALIAVAPPIRLGHVVDRGIRERQQISWAEG
jgi:hypothetical protein